MLLNIGIIPLKGQDAAPECGIQSARPTLSGTVEQFEHPHFVIHYTQTGSDATQPDTVRELASALATAFDVHLNTLQWALPPHDCENGGDSRLDVYVQDIPSRAAIGYTYVETFIGDNPHTPEQETSAATSYLQIENDMNPHTGTQALALVRVAAVHEIHHYFQYGYLARDRDHAFYEVGATWLETQVYPQDSAVPDYSHYVLAASEKCFGQREGKDWRLPYGNWILLDSIVQDWGSAAYLDLMQAIASGDDLLPSLYEGLEALGTSQQEVMRRYAIRNLLHDYALAFDGTIRLAAWLTPRVRLVESTIPLEELAYTYAEVQQGQYHLSINAPFELSLVGINGTAARVHALGQGGAVDTRDYEQAYLLILNTAVHADAAACRGLHWSLTVNPAIDNFIPADAEIWDASQFLLPQG